MAGQTQVVISFLKHNSKPEQGWLIDGAPTTPTQARLLCDAGFLANKYMYLDLSPKESRSFLMARGVPATTVDERLRTHEEKIPYIIDYFHGASHVGSVVAIRFSRVRRVANRSPTYFFPLNSCACVIADLIHYIDGGGVAAFNAKRWQDYMDKPVHGLVARTPQRIAVIGPVGSGKSTHARRLADRLELFALL
jgi:adenylate kinase family enzyme